MTYTVENLVTDAYYATGIVSREFQTVSGQQGYDGVRFLNSILDDKTIEKGLLPYYTTYNFTAVIGQEQYFIPNLEEVETLTFIINTIRYSMRPNKRISYQGDPRANQIQSLPFNYLVERCYGGANIFMYFLPVDTYQMTIWGLFRLANVTYNQDLSLTLDGFYIDYLKWRLAKRICNEYNYAISPGITNELEEIEIAISKRSGVMDLRMQVASTLDNYNNGVNYALANLGRGWTVA